MLAFGALPFDRHRAAALIVPAVLYCREADGSEWVTVATGPEGTPDEDPGRTCASAWSTRARRGPARRRAHTAWRVRPRCSDAEFEDRVARAVAAIDRHEVAKVVLARRVDVTADRPPDVAAVLRRWAALEPSCTLFSLPTPDGRFVGSQSGTPGRAQRAPRSAADRWPAPPTGCTGPTAPSPPPCSSRPRTPRSTAWWSTPSATRSRRGARTSTSRSTPNWSTSTTSPIWAPPSRGRCAPGPTVGVPDVLAARVAAPPDPGGGRRAPPGRASS